MSRAAEPPSRGRRGARVRESDGAIVRERDGLSALIAAAEKEDLQTWQAELRRLGLDLFLSSGLPFPLPRALQADLCRELCARPLITRVSSIPTPDQFNALGFGVGPSIPPNQVPPAPPSPPNVPPPDAANHPIGGSSELKGYFDFPAATQYKVEVAPAPGGPYTPIVEDVWGWNLPNPPLIWRNRSPGPGGWFNIYNVPPVDPPPDPLRRGIFFSDGGPTAIGEKTLVNWTTSAVSDGVHYLRLVARDGAETCAAARRRRFTSTTRPRQHP